MEIDKRPLIKQRWTAGERSLQKVSETLILAQVGAIVGIGFFYLFLGNTRNLIGPVIILAATIIMVFSPAANMTIAMAQRAINGKIEPRQIYILSIALAAQLVFYCLMVGAR